MDNDNRKKSMEPVINSESKVLILGSMPGNISLEKGEYYANPRNHFWKILFEIFNYHGDDCYEDKIEFLLANGLALWDVLESCEREGSLDSSIRNATVNDICGLLDDYPNIEMIVLNGGEAGRRLKNSYAEKLRAKVRIIQLPSTSPVPGRNVLKYDEKVKVWRAIKGDRDVEE